ncbi:MAG: TolC family protein [Lutispora sp.]|nr:TolC family protein [Lutispora sp.]MDD4833716.1 TolC family protein [Lutispora sp.]
MKKLICTLLCTTLVFANTAVYADIPKFRYSFDEAVKMAMDNTPEYKTVDRSIGTLYDTYEALEKRTPEDIKFVGGMKTFISQQVDPQINMENTYSSYQMTIIARNDIKRSVQIGLRQAVIGVQKAEMAYAETDIGKKNKQNELELLEIRYENGLISKNDYNDSKREIKDALKAFDNGEKAVDIAYRELNTLLGREDEKDIEVKLDDTVIPLEKLDLKQIKKDMLNNGKAASSTSKDSIRQLKENRYIASYRYDLIKERYDKYDLNKFSDKMREDIEDMYEDAKEKFEVADKAYQNAIDRFEKNFDDMIEDIEDLYEDIEDVKERITEEKANHSLYKLKYESGRMPRLEYEALGDKITLLENNLKELELDLNMKYAELLIYSDLKKVVKE